MKGNDIKSRIVGVQNVAKIKKMVTMCKIIMALCLRFNKNCYLCTEIL